jgi:hypothetical protein
MIHRPTRAGRCWRLAAVLFATVAGSLPFATHAAAAATPAAAPVPAAASAAPQAAQPADVKWTWLDDRSGKLVYSAGWTQYNNLAVQQSHTATSTKLAGKTVTTTCTCSAFRFYSVKSPALGTTEVRVDGQLVATASATAAATATNSTIVWASPIMAYGTHTLTLTSKTNWTEIDAIAVGSWTDPQCPGLKGQAASSSIEASGWSLNKIHDGVTIASDLGWHSATSSVATPTSPVCVQMDNGAVLKTLGVTIYPAHPSGYTPGTSFGFPQAYSIQVATQPDFSDGVTVATRTESADQQLSMVDSARVIPFNVAIPARYVRVVATTLGSIGTTYAAALAEIRPHVGTATQPLSITGTTISTFPNDYLTPQRLSATGSPGPTEFSVVSGAVPAGVLLTSDGYLGGLVAASATPGRYEARVQVTNSIGDVASATLVMTVAEVFSPASITCAANTSASVGDNVAIPVTVTGPSANVNVLGAPSWLRLSYLDHDADTYFYELSGVAEETGSWSILLYLDDPYVEEYCDLSVY